MARDNTQTAISSDHSLLSGSPSMWQPSARDSGLLKVLIALQDE
jgi:hypothetical protein